MENILQCAEKFKEAYNTQETCISDYSGSIMTNEQEEMVNNSTKPLNPSLNNYTFASHLSLVGAEMDNFQFSNQIAVYGQFYFLNFYGFHNTKTFYFSVNGPYNCPEAFFQTYKDVSMKYYDFIVNNVKE